MKKFKIYFVLALTALLFMACGQTEPSGDDISVGNTVEIESSSDAIDSSSIQNPSQAETDPYFNGDYNYLEENDDDASYVTDIIKTRIPQTNINGEITYLSHTYDQAALTAIFSVTDISDKSQLFCADFVCEEGQYELYSLYKIGPHIASSDGRYEIYKHQMGAYVDTYILSDNETGRMSYLCEEQATYGDDCGFFKNGDVYVMTHFGLKAFGIADGISDRKFDTQADFPCGKNYNNSGNDRWLMAIRREPDEQSYIVIYVEHPNNYDIEDRASEFQLKYNYKVGILNEHGALQKSWDTGVPAVFMRSFNSVYMFKPDANENIIEFYVQNKGADMLRGTFDLSTGQYTSVKDYEAP